MMKFSELSDGAKGISAVGEIGYIGKVKLIQGTNEKTKKDYDFKSQFLVINKVQGKVKDTLTGKEVDLAEDSIGVNIANVEVVNDDRGKQIVLNECLVKKYKDKDEATQTCLQVRVVRSIGDRVLGEEKEEKKPEETVTKETTTLGKGAAVLEMSKEGISLQCLSIAVQLKKEGMSIADVEATFNAVVNFVTSERLPQNLIARIHILLGEKKVADKQYREALKVYGVNTSKYLSEEGARQIIQWLEELPHKDTEEKASEKPSEMDGI